MFYSGSSAPSGALSLQRIRPGGSFSSVPFLQLSLLSLLWHGFPRPGLSWEVFCWRAKNLPNLMRGFWKLAIARTCRITHGYGQVSLVVIRDGRSIDLGIASVRVVTDAGVKFIVDNLRASIATIANMKYHGFGTGTNAEAAGDTTLQTELTTQYATDNTRPTGSQTNNGNNVYRTVGTLSPDANVAITEHGVFDQASNAGGTLLDRSKFSVVNLTGSADSLQVTYDFTITSGG